MIVVGVVTGILSGVGPPGHLLLFGEVINQFIYHSVATDIVRPRVMEFVMNESLYKLNVSFDDIVCDRTWVNELFTRLSENGTDMYICTGGEVFGEVINFICDPADKLQDEVKMFAYYYLVIAVGVLLTAFLSNSLLNSSAYRQTRRMRLAFFRSVLSQEIGWFDVTDSAELSTRLAE